MKLHIPSLLDSLRRDRYIRDPELWLKERLNGHAWSKQREILRSVVENRFTGVPSAHGLGKTFIAAVTAAWWLDCHSPGSAFVVTTAPTFPQVRAILWQEIGRIFNAGQLSGRINQTEWFMNVNGAEELVAFGRKPADLDPSAFQGIHRKYVLVIIDEAGGVKTPIWTAAKSLLTGAECRLLAIGNPDEINSEFEIKCRPGSGYNVIPISAFDSPNMTGEVMPQHILDTLVSQLWIDEAEHEWGIDNPFYKSKVLGIFPENSPDSLFSIGDIRGAQDRELIAAYPVEIGCDVGGGKDKNSMTIRRGDVARIALRDQQANTMRTLENLIALGLAENSCSAIRIDRVGIGAGACDRAAEIAADQGLLISNPERVLIARMIRGINVGVSAEDSTQFANLRAEGYWALHERFVEGRIDIDRTDDKLAAQLANIKYKRSAGRIQIESKAEMKARGIHSPDDADSLMLAFLNYQGPVTTGKPYISDRAVFGRRRR